MDLACTTNDVDRAGLPSIDDARTIHLANGTVAAAKPRAVPRDPDNRDGGTVDRPARTRKT
jgi:hypothetical protein